MYFVFLVSEFLNVYQINIITNSRKISRKALKKYKFVRGKTVSRMKNFASLTPE